MVIGNISLRERVQSLLPVPSLTAVFAFPPPGMTMTVPTQPVGCVVKFSNVCLLVDRKWYLSIVLICIFYYKRSWTYVHMFKHHVLGFVALPVTYLANISFKFPFPLTLLMNCWACN